MDVICFTIILVITIAARSNLQRVLMRFDEILLYRLDFLQIWHLQIKLLNY